MIWCEKATQIKHRPTAVCGSIFIHFRIDYVYRLMGLFKLVEKTIIHFSTQKKEIKPAFRMKRLKSNAAPPGQKPEEKNQHIFTVLGAVIFQGHLGSSTMATPASVGTSFRSLSPRSFRLLIDFVHDLLLGH